LNRNRRRLGGVFDHGGLLLHCYCSCHVVRTFVVR
jgi:hypothetical protein